MINNNSILDRAIPLEFYLSQNYPDPFRERITIKYCVAFKMKVVITIYNDEGREIKKFVDEQNR